MSHTTSTLQLEQIRRHKGVSLEQIAENTKITTRFLRAIESEEFDKLPGGVFNISYIRQYANAIGVNENELLGRYRAHEAHKAEEEARSSRPNQRSWSLRSCLSWLLRNPSPVPRY
jgi:cytoskeletal protein RodZ